MHSVVVFGDVRTHLINCRFTPESIAHKAVRLYGGAYFMSAAIDEAVASLPQTAIKPRVYSFQRPNPEDDQWYGDHLKWELSPHPQAEGKLRLKGHNKPKRHVAPALSAELLEVLRDNKPFEEREESPFKMCPDILVLDDLKAELRETELLQGTTAKKFRDEPTDKTAAPENFQLALSHLVERLKIPGQKEESKGYPGIEPVIVCSVMNELPNLRDPQRTIWRELFTDSWLRDRTVVLIDAADLRDHHHLAISSGLSWERTAQDTIVALQRSHALRPFLQFGQLIVRYGVTGALHIVRRYGDWSYYLHFDPEHDDVKWTDPVLDGRVLGQTSIYAATFVRSLTRVCNERKEKPLLPDLAIAIGNAIPVAIRRCQFLTTMSYGCTEADLDSLHGNKWIPPDIFVGDVPPELNAKLAIARVKVPLLQMRSWSIVNQSAQIRMGEIANRIVRFGPEVVLNQPSVVNLRNRHSLVEDLCSSIIGEFYQLFATQTNLRPQDVAKKLNSIRGKLIESHWVFGTRNVPWREKVIAEVDQEAWKAIRDAFIESWNHVATSVAQLPLSKIETEEPKEQIQQAARALERDLLRLLPKVVREIDYDQLDTVAAPFVRYSETDRYGETLIIDRREVEGFRAIQKLIKSHLSLVVEDKARRPLSLAVFGPPGSGKSTAVRSIVDNSGIKGSDTQDFTFNLAQFTRIDDLTDAFHKITGAIADRKIPIVFFDEFDAEFENSQLGWLKFFLAPMEDGRYRGVERVKDAVFVFAGGTAETFAEFSHEHRSRTDDQWVKFSKAKGPDFVSRLGGYVNIVGINPADPDDELYLLRRAILIRSILGKQQGLESREEARIDKDILRAMLHVPEFRHGGRSVRMLLDLCTSNSNSISKSSLPPIHQLNMLVDGKAFLDLVSNISANEARDRE